MHLPKQSFLRCRLLVYFALTLYSEKKKPNKNYQIIVNVHVLWILVDPVLLSS